MKLPTPQSSKPEPRSQYDTSPQQESNVFSVPQMMLSTTEMAEHSASSIGRIVSTVQWVSDKEDGAPPALIPPPRQSNSSVLSSRTFPPRPGSPRTAHSRTSRITECSIEIVVS